MQSTTTRPAALSRLDGWSLRRRLTLATVVLITLAALVIGLVSILSVRSILTQRLDDELGQASERASRAPSGTLPYPLPSFGEDEPGPGQIIGILGQSAGTLGVEIESGVVTYAGYLDEDGTRQELGQQASSQLAAEAVIGRPTTVDLGGDLGRYRVVAIETDGDEFIVGLPMDSLEQTVSQLIWIVLGVSAGGIGLATVVAYLIVRASVRPLERVEQTATEVSRLPLERGDVALAVRVPDGDADERTEVGRVGAAFNRMLGHVGLALAARQASEEKVRRFVSDASHELRTPLASIRGYAELTRMSPEDLPEDATYALGRIESEAARMTTIVEDLLLLARLDEGRALEREPVDMRTLVVDAVNDARVASTDHEWTVDVPAEDDALFVTGDDSRLFQVVANLLANARVHTPAGTHVRTSLEAVADSSGSGRVVVTVADDGPGIAAETLDRVFERFVRGDSSRSRATGSTGLGLAIVRAVVEVHGGSVSVDSVPGDTRFRIDLPLASDDR
ncbi:two-component system OmpR family sensor kinase [Labedella gwakjiensis]|uniref:histidine kinase n=1 Tax=Labedella gwakjiensis TaxID=390269 RepID=A0A2P8GXD6_9MICO|nr:HAMP domain-containing sensor histidine kinase [Labedella gwakjiensis]PSL38627.1 two-component system OmpR family sensor kinase [Labedella gwakjiensis]RUQ86869.1 sensor histidine kinase [Labedella gwakjiensis]